MLARASVTSVRTTQRVVGWHDGVHVRRHSVRVPPRTRREHPSPAVRGTIGTARHSSRDAKPSAGRSLKEEALSLADLRQPHNW